MLSVDFTDECLCRTTSETIEEVYDGPNLYTGSTLVSAGTFASATFTISTPIITTTNSDGDTEILLCKEHYSPALDQCTAYDNPTALYEGEYGNFCFEDDAYCSTLLDKEDLDVTEIVNQYGEICPHFEQIFYFYQFSSFSGTPYGVTSELGDCSIAALADFQEL